VGRTQPAATHCALPRGGGGAGRLRRVQHAGSRSWRFAEGLEQLPIVALFVRDAAELDVPWFAGLPPRLDDMPPHHSPALTPDQRAEAGVQWVAWWHAVLAQAARHEQGSPIDVDQRDWIRRMLAETSDLFDPPDFTSLTDNAALRAAMRTYSAAGLRWADARRRALLLPRGGSPGQFDYALTRQVAEQIARRHHVDSSAVQACAILLPVHGTWWHRLQPGVVVSSVAAARDPATARSILNDAFESGLTGTG
jgi:hypothetical protein